MTCLATGFWTSYHARYRFHLVEKTLNWSRKSLVIPMTFAPLLHQVNISCQAGHCCRAQSSQLDKTDSDSSSLLSCMALPSVVRLNFYVPPWTSSSAMPSYPNFGSYSVYGFQIIPCASPGHLQSFLGECCVAYGADQIRRHLEFLSTHALSRGALSLPVWLVLYSYNYEN
jgi:hypothetical protein